MTEKEISKVEIEEIKRGLKLLKFDSSKHRTLKSALFDFFKEEKYDNVMRGIVTNKEDLQMVKMVTEAYQNLKKYEDEILSGKISLDEFGTQKKDFSNKKQDEFISINNKIYKKNSNDKYEVQDFNGNIDLERANTFEQGFLIDKNNNILNLQGQCIYKIDTENFDVDEVAGFDDILVSIKLHDKLRNSKTVYCLLDGSFVLDLASSNNWYSEMKKENVNKVIEYFHENRPKYLKKFIYLLKENRTLNYLDEDILSIEDKFICTRNNYRSITYWNYNGEKIINSDEDNYSKIRTSFKEMEDKKHIVVVAKINKFSEEKYGYYDLDNKCIIGDIRFKELYDWIGYVGLAEQTETGLTYGVTYDGKFFVIKDINESNHYIPTECLKLSESFYLFKDYLDTDLRLYTIEKFKKSKKIKDNDWRGYINDGIKYILTLKKDRMIIHNKEKQEFICNYHSEYYGKDKDNKFVWLDEFGNYHEYNLFDGSKDLDYIKHIKNISSSKKFNASFYLNSLYKSGFLSKEYKKLLSNVEKATNIKKIEENQDLQNNPMNDKKLKSNDEITTFIDQGTFLEVIKETRNEEKDNKYIFSSKNSQNPNATIKRWNGDHFGKAVLDMDNHTYYIGEEKHNYYIYCSPTENFFIGDEKSAIVDCSYGHNNHFIITLYYNDFPRKILVDTKGFLLIDLSLDIKVEKDCYIVKKCDGKVQLYDSNVIPLTLPCDNIYLTSKRYVGEDGELTKTEEKFVIENFGYTYLLDGQDYVIEKNSDYNNVLDEINALLMDDREEENKLQKTKAKK